MTLPKKLACYLLTSSCHLMRDQRLIFLYSLIRFHNLFSLQLETLQLRIFLTLTVFFKGSNFGAFWGWGSLGGDALAIG